jgi:hypothetical protein
MCDCNCSKEKALAEVGLSDIGLLRTTINDAFNATNRSLSLCVPELDIPSHIVYALVGTRSRLSDILSEINDIMEGE